MATDLERLSQALAGRFALERELGRGGMATVYLARDVADVDRRVAIKVLDPDLSMALGAERFRREIEIERTLDHPNILGVLDSGDADGVLWYAMPYVAGESLRARMDREGALPVEDALRIACEVADALHHAHQHGIVHRDIKPENVLLEEGHALVADFGIARALSAEQSERLTQTGVSLGTPLYMSPEQAFAERDLDGRSDVYSLGCVLFEMLVGQPPFTGPNAQAIAARHHMEEVPSITIVRPAVSDDVEDVVVCALAKSRVDRCATSAEFAARLRAIVDAGHATDRRTVATRRAPPRPGGRRDGDPLRRVSRGWVAAAAAAIVLAAAGVWGTLARSSSAEEAGGDLTADSRVAVMYLTDRTNGALAYLADGLTESLIAELAAVGIHVVSRNGVLPYRNVNVGVDSARILLDEPALIMNGAVDQRDGRTYVNLTLWNASGIAKRDFRFDVSSDSAAVVRDALVDSVLVELRPMIGDEAKRLTRRRAAGGEAAWTLVQRAEHAFKRADDRWSAGDSVAARQALAAADSLAEEGARLSPEWSEPTVLRGRVAFRRAAMEVQPTAKAPHLAEAEALAARVLRGDSANVDALELRALATSERALRGLARDTAETRRLVDAAVRDLEAATREDSTRASVWVRLSDLAYWQYDLAAASQAADRAYRADRYLENAPDVLWRLFATSYDARVLGKATEWCEVGAERFPADPLFARCRILVMTMGGASVDPPQLWEAYATVARLTPAPDRALENRLDRILLAAALAHAPGMKDSARAVLAGARADRTIDPTGELRGYEAFARVALGEHEEAVRLLDAYLRDNPSHREGFSRINAWWWAPLKDDPRFLRLIGVAH